MWRISKFTDVAYMCGELRCEIYAFSHAISAGGDSKAGKSEGSAAKWPRSPLFPGIRLWRELRAEIPEDRVAHGGDSGAHAFLFHVETGMVMAPGDAALLIPRAHVEEAAWPFE